MKHKLNLNGPGCRLFSLAGILLIISLSLYGLARILSSFGLRVVWLHFLAGLLAGIGVFMLLFLGVLLIVEAFQDRAVELNYLKQRSRRIPAGNRYYECQFCGSRRVREEDKVCPVCGRELRDSEG